MKISYTEHDKEQTGYYPIIKLHPTSAEFDKGSSIVPNDNCNQIEAEYLLDLKEFK